jgi:molybdate transport system ATP-binding protein
MTLEIRAKIARSGGFSLDIDMSIPDRQVSALYGPSGSGKSTILRLIAGLENEEGVTISFNEMIWQKGKKFLPPHQRRVGYVFQHLMLFPHLNAEENLNYAETRQQKSGGLTRGEVVEMLDLGHLLKQMPGQLSGGEQQRVAIARALLSNPQLLVMDEPLGSIDTTAKNRILPYLQRLHTRLEIPVVYVSHSLNEVQYFADTVFSISEGRILNQRSVVEFSTQDLSSPDADLAAILRCEVAESIDDFSLTRLIFGDEVLYIASDRFELGDKIRVRIPARDVSLARQRQPESSILNSVQTRIVEITEPTSGPSAIVRLQCGSQYLLARITRKSLHDLNLKIDETIYAQIKGVALMAEYER